ncbi:glutaredoxin [Aphanomyces invadans]|uniref:Glutaredoxin n=1 Tax=Aphanomyces invadans TaxID=157072 RepID=A0A024TXH1_9STRA|nr:glutaredoxin [Aphanomyces invadans]ETV98684.1 glutaredoxin [Aphanomyces invadans]|eukprot:XP_008872881.1 glutaredoxin [Aphanomyces invadans]
MGSNNSSGATPEAAAFVQQAINTNGVTIFSKTYCPYCDMAKKTLTSVGAQFEVIELNKRPDGDAIQSVLEELTGRDTVPNVFIKTTTIGGGTDVAKLHRDGKLVQMLKEAGVLA